MPFKKNTAVAGMTFGLVNKTNGTAVTTGTPAVYYTLDGGTQASVADTPVHEGNGQWSVDLTQGEMNGDVVGLLFTHADAVPVQYTIKTETKLVSELNDIAATDIVSGPAIATSTGGVVDNVALVDLVTLIDTNGIAADSLSTGALADINGEVDTALSDINLDHLAAASATLGTDVDDDSIIGQIISSSAVSGYDRTLHSLEVSGDKTQLITSAGVTAVVGLISDGDTFEVTRGKALTGIELTVPTSTIDLSGYNATFGVTRIATDNAVTSDTAAEQFNFTITDPGGAGQKITGSIPKTSTANWTLDNDMVVETFTPTGRAYRWSIDINNSHTGTAQAGASSTITLAADASDDDDFYNGVTVEITGGTGSGQTKTITDYVGSTRVATVDSSWASNPDNTSVYHVAASDTGCVPLAKGEISVTAADTNCGQPS